MAGLAVLGRQLPLDVLRIARFGMDASRPVTNLASCVPEMRRFLFGTEAPGLAVSGRVAFVALLHFGFGKALSEARQALEGMGFFVELSEAVEFGGMAFLAGSRPHVCGPGVASRHVRPENGNLNEKEKDKENGKQCTGFAEHKSAFPV